MQPLPCQVSTGVSPHAPLACSQCVAALPQTTKAWLAAPRSHSVPVYSDLGGAVHVDSRLVAKAHLVGHRALTDAQSLHWLVAGIAHSGEALYVASGSSVLTAPAFAEWKVRNACCGGAQSSVMMYAQHNDT